MSIIEMAQTMKAELQQIYKQWPCPSRVVEKMDVTLLIVLRDDGRDDILEKFLMPIVLAKSHV